MWRMMSRMLSFVAIVTCLSGCAGWSQRQKLPVLPPTEAPRIVMNSVSPSRVIPVGRLSAPPKIEIVDNRPGLERHYYPGSLHPRRWQDGMSMVPMEAFDPPIEDQIRSRCIRDFEETDIDSVSIELISFQFVFDQRLKLKGESEEYVGNWLAQKENEDEERSERRSIADKRSDELEREQRDLKRSLGMENDEPSFTEGLFSDLATGVVRGLAIDKPRKVAQSAHARQLRRPLPVETPQFISEGKREGLNCQLKAVVTVSHADGRIQQLNAETALHAPLDESLDVQAQVGDLVAKTIRDFTRFIMD